LSVLFNPSTFRHARAVGLGSGWRGQQQLANKLKHGFRALLAQRGVDLAYGRTLPRLLRDAGLSEVQSAAYFPIGGPACTDLSGPPWNGSATVSSRLGRHRK